LYWARGAAARYGHGPHRVRQVLAGGSIERQLGTAVYLLMRVGPVVAYDYLRNAIAGRTPSRDGATLETMAERSQSESQIPRSVAAYLADFLPLVFLAVVFLGAAFFAVTFLAVVFVGASFFAGAFLAVVFRAVVFLAGVFFAEALGAGSRPVIFLAAETTALTMFPPISVMMAPLMQTSAKLHVARLRKRAV
jgi:hypothetical protein